MSDTIAAMPNFRDAGGHETSGGGRMRRGFLYRSDQPAGLGAEDLSRLSSLGLRTVYDLRTAAEVAMEPALVPAGATRVRLDVLADEQDGAPARIIAMLSNPPQASRELGDGRAAAMFTRVYRSLVSTPSAIVVMYSLSSAVRYGTSFVASSNATTSTPVAIGSSVPQ